MVAEVGRVRVEGHHVGLKALPRKRQDGVVGRHLDGAHAAADDARDLRAQRIGRDDPEEQLARADGANTFAATPPPITPMLSVVSPSPSSTGQVCSRRSLHTAMVRDSR